MADRDRVKPFKRVTLAMVAKNAGVSRATASLVLRGSPLVAEQTRAQVLASMERLGYVYHRAAASLRTHRLQTIGLIVSDITNPFFAELTVSIEAQLERQNYAVLLCNTSDELSKQARIFDTMRQYPLDGLLICPARGTQPAMLDPLRRWGLPFVLVTRYLDEETDYVGPDNVRGAEVAVEHLLGHGHQRIAFLGGPVDSSARRDRLLGYLHAHQRHGVPVDDSLAVTSPVTREGGLSALLELLASPNPPTAALCYNDVVALGAMLGLRTMGRIAGRDFAVIGFDDIAEAALWRPALTTMATTPSQIGIEATRLLLARIENPCAPNRRITLQPQLVVRDSCGCGQVRPSPSQASL